MQNSLGSNIFAIDGDETSILAHAQNIPDREGKREIYFIRVGISDGDLYVVTIVTLKWLNHLFNK